MEIIEEYTNPVFGQTRDATVIESVLVEMLVDQIPVEVFGALNQSINKKGLCIEIKILRNL
jgi:hypothetical protein